MIKVVEAVKYLQKVNYIIDKNLQNNNKDLQNLLKIDKNWSKHWSVDQKLRRKKVKNCKNKDTNRLKLKDL